MALNAAAAAAAACLCTEAKVDACLDAGARKALKYAQEAQARCSPPSVQFMLAFTKLTRQEQSDVGRQCMANIDAIFNAIFNSIDSKACRSTTRCTARARRAAGR